jgi:hypothetical protein
LKFVQYHGSQGNDMNHTMRRQALRSAAIMSMAALPVVVLGLIALPDPRERYWASVYVVWGAMFAALCFATTARAVRRVWGSNSGLSRKDLCFGGMTAWGLSFPVLLLTTLTPLCLGQNNGDGWNNATMCLFLAVVWFAFMSLPVLGGVLLLARWTYNAKTATDRTMTREDGEKATCQPSHPPLSRDPQTGRSEGEG